MIEDDAHECPHEEHREDYCHRTESDSYGKTEAQYTTSVSDEYFLREVRS